MKLERWLNLAGVLNIIVAILMFLASSLTIIPVVFLIISGFFYRSYFNKEGPYKRRGSLIALGIINLIFNFVSGIIVLEVSGLIKTDDNYEIKERKIQKINGLLQLGVVLVLLSGIMIATNQTLEVPNLYKVIGLILLSIIFFFLSYMSKKYLKLESSFKTYFLLGMAFIVISFIGLYYYKLLGSISYESINYLYFYPSLFLLISVCLHLTRKFLKIEKIDYITTITCVLVLYTWFNAIGISIILNLLLLTFMISLINFIYKPSCKLTEVVKKSAYYLSIALIPLNMIVLVNNDFDIYSCLLAIITTINIFHILVTKKDKISAYISIPTLILNSLIIICNNPEIAEIKVVFFQVMMIVFYCLIKLIDLDKINEGFKRIYKILFNIAFIATAFVSLTMHEEAALIVTSLLLIQNIIGVFEGKVEENYLEPVKSLLFIIGLLIFINSKVSLDIIFNLFVIEIIQLVLHLIIKNKFLKKVHYILYLVFVGLISLMSTSTSEIHLALITSISAIIPFIISILKREENLGITIFTSVALILTNTNLVFSKIYYINSLIALILMIIYACIFRNSKDKKYIALFSIALLILRFINISELDYNVYTSLNLLSYSYIGLLITSLINNKESKDIFMTIYFTIITLASMFNENIWLFITISLVTISLVIFGFIKDFKKIKITAIILFILNLIYQLKDIWKDIPVAIYLLLIGLVLIGIVVVKEIRENKN